MDEYVSVLVLFFGFSLILKKWAKFRKKYFLHKRNTCIFKPFEHCNALFVKQILLFVLKQMAN